MPVLFAVFLLSNVNLAHAAVFKCTGDTAVVVYQDTPCMPGKELRNFDTDPPALSVIPGTATPAPAPQTKPDRKTNVHREAAEKVRDTQATARKFIQIGMSEAEVIQRIGRPEVNTGAGRGKGKQWSYLPTAGDPNTITTLTFAGGKVASVDRKVVR